MPSPGKTLALLFVLLLDVSLQGCAANRRLPPSTSPAATAALYIPIAEEADQELLQRHAPCFLIEEFQDDFNRIGSPSARSEADGGHEIYIDTDQPAIYTLVQPFSSRGKNYTNLIYRVHFPEVPWPRLTSGRNVGLLVYVTLDAQEEPILITTLHTCGCYLAMVPTSNLPSICWPSGWPEESQEVYGETLPAHLAWPDKIAAKRLVITLRGATHRVKAIDFREAGESAEVAKRTARMRPMNALERLPHGEETVSLFEQAGWRKGYVKGSSKPLERLLISWWAIDPLVGVDKALGPPEETGSNLHTSLKFWARKASNIWNFPEFLSYWGWRLPLETSNESRRQPPVSR
jgi:hypothetical protein